MAALLILLLLESSQQLTEPICQFEEVAPLDLATGRHLIFSSVATKFRKFEYRDLVRMDLCPTLSQYIQNDFNGIKMGVPGAQGAYHLI